MTATAHALVAGAIASHVHDPVSAVALAGASHFILDSIPHWDMGTNWRGRSKRKTGAISIVETLLGITVAYFLYLGKASFPVLTACIIASLLPDWMEAPWYIFFARHDKHEPKKNAGFWEKCTYYVYKFENTFHTKAQFPLGLLTQVVTVAFFIVLLK